jgi:hypothetical protein
MDLHARVGDHIVVDTGHVGEGRREGEVLEVLGDGDTVHYRMRWADGHESIFYPSVTAHVVPETGRS